MSIPRAASCQAQSMALRVLVLAEGARGEGRQSPAERGERFRVQLILAQLPLKR